MKIVLQRVKEAAVEVQGKVVGKIGRGICLLVGIEKGDSEEDAHFLAKKVTELRVFPDEEGKGKKKPRVITTEAELYELSIVNVGANANALRELKSAEEKAIHGEEDKLAEIEVPTLILAGDEDIMVSTENSRSMHRKIKNSELKIFSPKIGHYIQFEALEEYNKTVENFLKKLH